MLACWASGCRFGYLAVWQPVFFKPTVLGRQSLRAQIEWPQHRSIDRHHVGDPFTAFDRLHMGASSNLDLAKLGQGKCLVVNATSVAGIVDDQLQRSPRFAAIASLVVFPCEAWLVTTYPKSRWPYSRSWPRWHFFLDE